MITIIESNLMVDVELKTFNRLWRERLFSWPWKPWKTTKTIQVTRPSEKIMWIGDKMICHPSIARRLKEALPLGTRQMYPLR